MIEIFKDNEYKGINKSEGCRKVQVCNPQKILKK